MGKERKIVHYVEIKRYLLYNSGIVIRIYRQTPLGKEEERF